MLSKFIIFKIVAGLLLMWVAYFSAAYYLPALRLEGVSIAPNPIVAHWDSEQQAFIGTITIHNGTLSATGFKGVKGCSCDQSWIPTHIPPATSVSCEMILTIDHQNAGSNIAYTLNRNDGGKPMSFKVFLTDRKR